MNCKEKAYLTAMCVIVVPMATIVPGDGHLTLHINDTWGQATLLLKVTT